MKLTFDFDRDEIATLIALLNQKGIGYLIGEGASLSEDEENLNPVVLIQRLAACNYPLVEDAAISLFILHPELAPSVAEALQSSQHETAENLAVLVLATLYMQQWWLFRLAFALGQLPSFPEEPFVSLWQERHLPPPSSGFGLDGLLALEEYQQQRFSLPLNFRHDWQNQIDHLLIQEGAHHRQLSDEAIQMLKQITKTNIPQYVEEGKIA